MMPLHPGIVRFARGLFGNLQEQVERMRMRFGSGVPDIHQNRARNAQERLWAGGFGDAYTTRNRGGVEANKALFAEILAIADGVRSVIELGAGSGANLVAIQTIDPEIETTGVEINPTAITDLRENADRVIEGTLLGLEAVRLWDMAFTKGVLIHIAPENLPMAYEALYRCSRRYILVCEYYSPRPEAIPYRGVARALWKRDFAGELMDAYPNLKLVDYGFTYHRDPFSQDDTTWFLLERR